MFSRRWNACRNLYRLRASRLRPSHSSASLWCTSAVLLFASLSQVGCSSQDSVKLEPPVAEEAGELGNESSENAASDTVQGVNLVEADHGEILKQLEAHAGKVIVLDVWSTACLPCMREFPNLVELAAKYPDDVAAVSVNIDYIGLKKKTPSFYQEKVMEFLRDQGASNVHNYLAVEPDDDMRDKFGIAAIPAILVYNRAGEQVHKLTESTSGPDGLSYEDDVVPVVEALLAIEGEQ
ncbi:MAG TPA: hypothetical protein DDW52_14225 [Planctomycetaceae bacterium]|nr:hypothetical protein [Planctomycetaceae bacterium]